MRKNKNNGAKLAKPEIAGVRTDFSLLTNDDLHWFNEGSHCHLYQKLGAHPTTHDGQA
jgi:hypothetical protein